MVARSIGRRQLTLTAAVFLKVMLVIFFRAIELGCRNNFSDDRPGKPTGLIQLLPGSQRDFFLSGVGEENGAPILGTSVGAGPIARGRIVMVPEDGQQLIVRNVPGIIGNANGFGMTSLTGADFVVGRMLGMATGVPNFRDQHPLGLAQCFFNSPEAAGRKNRSLGRNKFQRDRIDTIPQPR